MQIIVAIHNTLPTRANQNKCMKALPSKEINNLSPLVVSKPKIPFLGLPPGDFFSQITIAVKHKAMNIKNAAVCQVQAIQVMNSKSKKLFSFSLAMSPHVAAFKTLNIIILFLMQIL